MPSDAYMELSDPAVWGETYDEQFGMGPTGRKLGAFEISKFDFGVTPEQDDDKKDAPVAGAPPTRPAPAGGSSPGKAPSKHEEPIVGPFTINKYVDKGSPDLFLACCKKTKIAWAIISIRESGDVSRKPYLVMEFQNLHVISFKWALDPASADSAEQFETVEFKFETVLLKYSRQDRSGEHAVVKIKGWDNVKNVPFDKEIDTSLQSGTRDT